MNRHREAGQSNNVLQDCLGLKSWSGGSICHPLFAALTGWLVWILAGFTPYTAARLLQTSTLQHADYALVKLLDGRQYLLKVHRLSLERKSLLQGNAGHGAASTDAARQLKGFRLFLRTYVYNAKQDRFQPVPAMPYHLPQQICQAIHALQQVETAGADWQTFNATQKEVRKDMLRLYGNKRHLVPPRSPFELAGPTGPATQALFLLQILEQIYLIYRGRYFYPVVINLFSVPALHAMAAMLNQQRKKVMALMNESRLTPMVLGQWVRATSSHRLVPGDVIVLQSGRALCDMVLLRGACLVTEAVLSGEAEQLHKSAYVPEQGKEYEPDRDRSCTIYAGTLVQQVWNPNSSEDEVLVMVCQTGLNTVMGKTIRELLVPTKLAKADPVVVDIGRLYLFALVLQCLIFIPYMIKGPEREQDAKLVIWRLLDLVIFAAPPGLPLVLMLVGAVARDLLLKKDGLLLLSPQILKQGADVDVVCFDKTGTLTDSLANLHGVLPVHKAAFASLQYSPLRWSNRLKQMFAVCHSLSMVSKSVVAGADMERNLFKAVEACFLDRDTIVLPRRPDTRSSSNMAKLTIVKVLEFSSQTLRSGVVVMTRDAPHGSALFFLRGAPAVIKNLVDPATVPHDFEQVMDDYSSKSFRLLAGAVGVIRDVYKLDLQRMTQHQIEACATHMQLLCLVVLTNSVRQDSRQTISQVQDGGGIRTMMITGDYHHTAIAVARDVGMIKPESRVIIIDTCARSESPPETSPLSPHTVNRALLPCTSSLMWQSTNAAQQLDDLDRSHSQEQADVVLMAGPATIIKHVSWERLLDDNCVVSQLAAKQEPSLQQIDGRDTASADVTLSVPSMQRSMRVTPDSPGPPGPHPEDLVFATAGMGNLGASEALAALAEGQMRCAVTGDALEYLLQRHDLSLLETVMRNAVVFSRMQPGQKGQVMDLLSTRGVHQLSDGQPRHIQGLGKTTMFCGDGINDLAALSAADVGMAIGADAVIAAELSTTKSSVAGVAQFIKVSKAGWAILIALFQYMVVYQCVVAEANMVAFFVDGSSLSNLQGGAIDLQVMAMALACCWVPPRKQMSRHKPPPYACTFISLTVLAVAAGGLQVVQICLMAFLCTRPGFMGGTGSAQLNPVSSAAWLGANLQLLAPLLSLTMDTRRFCEPLLRTKPLLIIATYTILSYIAVFVRPDPSFNPLGLYDFTQSFRFEWAGVAAVGMLLYMVVVRVTRKLLQRCQLSKVHPKLGR